MYGMHGVPLQVITTQVHPPLVSLPIPIVPKTLHAATIIASLRHRSQEVGKQVTNGDDTLAPSLLVYHDDSLEPKVRELLEHSLKTWRGTGRARCGSARERNEQQFAAVTQGSVRASMHTWG